jgi:hypothetical protein
VNGRSATRTTKPRARRGGLAAALALAAGWAAPALACPVCYGEASGPVIGATQLSVAFLGGLVYLLLFGGFGMAIVVRRRALKTMDPRHGLRLIEGGAVEDGAVDGAEGGIEREDVGRPEAAAPEETSER